MDISKAHLLTPFKDRPKPLKRPKANKIISLCATVDLISNQSILKFAKAFLSVPYTDLIEYTKR